MERAPLAVRAKAGPVVDGLVSPSVKFTWSRAGEQALGSQKSYTPSIRDVGAVLLCTAVATDTFGRASEPFVVETQPVAPGAPQIAQLTVGWYRLSLTLTLPSPCWRAAERRHPTGREKIGTHPTDISLSYTTHPRDTSRSNLAAALALVRGGPNPILGHNPSPTYPSLRQPLPPLYRALSATPGSYHPARLYASLVRFRFVDICGTV
jgi:hypothetical protein